MNAEILAPAGDEATAKKALLAGADAVYLGLKSFSARGSAENLDFAALSRTADFAHLLGAKIYVCLNTLVKDSETDDFFRFVRESAENGADAVILQDVFLGKILSERCPELVLHLSTQAGCCNEYGARLARDCGFSRVVLARETPLKEVEAVSKIIETEVFVQGALCSSFSGQCYFSSFIGNNSGNRGHCKQPCRKKYAIDRAGYEKFAYALSPADLCVGSRVTELLNAGASSLKIEGRMRRIEYVASAVRYYRALLDGENDREAFSDLKRSYNRGDYTEGLMFGEKNFLSRDVQGHIGERVGTLDKTLFCRSDYRPHKGDGFKILRSGVEVGGAVPSKIEREGFYLSSFEKLMCGDEVRLTTDSSVEERIPEKKREISLAIECLEGRPLLIRAGEFVYRGITPEPAKNAPLSAKTIADCFLKTGEDPFAVTFQSIDCGNVFMPISALNETRRAFYRQLKEFLLPKKRRLSLISPVASLPSGTETRRAVLSVQGEDAEILILKPRDYSEIRIPKCNFGQIFLYLPPFFTDEQILRVEAALQKFDGIYCDGLYGLLLAEKHSLAFFAGTGFNLTNRFSVSEVKKRCAYFALSKELSAREQRALSTEGAFVLDKGAVKLMDLCYCPFEKNCDSCDRREVYAVTDESGRKFPMRRYRTQDGCRFELFNSNPLAENSVPLGKLFDHTVNIDAPETKGHLQRSML